MPSVKHFTQFSCSDEPSDVVYCLQFSKACFPMENMDFTPPLILVFLFIIFYRLVLSGNVVSGGNNVSLNKGDKIKMLSFIKRQKESVWLLRCVQALIK